MNKKFYITFGFGQVDKQGNSLDNCYTTLYARNKLDARDVATERFGDTWANLYTSEGGAGVHRLKMTYLEEVEL